MSWLDDIRVKLSIITGDGKRYEPHWKKASVVVPYNVSEFNFPGIKGTYVDRREQLGSKFNLEIIFQGDDHLEEMKAFVKSAEDRRPWLIIHPFYDILNVQPSALNIDNSDYNTTKIQITATQTIEKKYPVTVVIPVDKIDEDIQFINDVVVSQLTDPNQDLIQKQVNDFTTKTEPKIVESYDSQEFSNQTNETNEKVANISEDREAAIISFQELLALPSDFNQSVASRLLMISTNFDSLVNQILGTIDDVKNLPNDLKNTFEAFGVSLLNSLCRLVSKPTEDDYGTRNDVNTTIEAILTMNNTFIEVLDQLEVGTGGNPQDYQPNHESLTKLNDLVNYTVSNLFVIAKNAKQERSEIMTEDSDFITLAHRFYGLRINDVTIDELIAENNLGLNGILCIKKGTKVKYYI